MNEPALIDNRASLNRVLERAAWGIFFIWLGITALFQLPNGSTAIGIGLILLGLNLARYLKSLPTSGFTIALGVIALVMGIVDLSKALFNIRPDIPLFPVLLILLGVVFLVREVLRMAKR
jgi:hypothetical protein